MPTLPITVPNVFANATSNIALSLLDADFLAVAQAINGIGNGSTPLTNVTITGGTVSGVVVTSVPTSGQCRLIYVSPTQIGLIPHNGQYIQIAGVLYAIPAAGITVSNAGLGNNQTYFVYVFNSGGTLALEVSSTGHATDISPGNVGIECKSSDNSRSLVGMVFTTNHAQFGQGVTSDDNILYYGVASWFNRHATLAQTSINSTLATGAPLTQIGPSIAMCLWIDEVATLTCFGRLVNQGVVADTATTSVYVNGALYSNTSHGLQSGYATNPAIQVLQISADQGNLYQIYGTPGTASPFLWGLNFWITTNM